MRRISKKKREKVKAIDVLLKDNPERMTVAERAALTISCEDSANIPKVPGAGQVIEQDGQKVQIMHNGVKVIAGGYYGELIQPIIEKLKGHHEPQEEKVYYELLKRINRRQPAMIELGAHWAYYSLWLKNNFKDAVNICCEPDPHNLEIGTGNARLNGFNDIKFYQTLAGQEDMKIASFSLDSNPNELIELPIRTVDSLCTENSIDYLDILHIDTQGAELSVLEGAARTIEQKKLRFIVLSTHHYLFSKDPLTHQKCEKFITDRGGFIIASHTIMQSFSGDGLIVASFEEEDKNFKVAISSNNGQSLFRPYEEDLALLIDSYDGEAGDD